MCIHDFFYGCRKLFIFHHVVCTLIMLCGYGFVYVTCASSFDKASEMTFIHLPSPSHCHSESPHDFAGYCVAQSSASPAGMQKQICHILVPVFYVDIDGLVILTICSVHQCHQKRDHRNHSRTHGSGLTH